MSNALEGRGMWAHRSGINVVVKPLGDAWGVHRHRYFEFDDAIFGFLRLESVKVLLIGCDPSS